MAGTDRATLTPPLHRSLDPDLLIGTRAVRGFAAGALSIVFALDLAATGYASLAIGLLLGLALGGAAAWAIAVPTLERRVGRRSVFYLGASAFAAGGFLLWADLGSPVVVLVALLLGGIVAGSADVSPLGAAEQAALAAASDAEGRTRRFVGYNFAGYLGNALGALAAAPISALGAAAAMELAAGGRDPVLLLYGLLGVGLLPAYRALSADVDRPEAPASAAPLAPTSRSTVYSLSALFAADAFGGGLIVTTIVVYYLSVRFHPPVDQLSLVFFLSNLAAAISLLLALPLARRVGLVRTMVYSHLPSSVLLLAFPFAPTFELASLVWVGRSLLSQMDVPTRQSYVQAVVPAGDRAAAAGYTTAARSAQAFGAPVTGAFFAAGGPFLAAPFVLAGSVKVAYDLLLFRRFRELRPPEEGDRHDDKVKA